MKFELHFLKPVCKVLCWRGGRNGAHEDGPFVRVVWIEAGGAAIGVDGSGIGAVDLKYKWSDTVKGSQAL